MDLDARSSIRGLYAVGEVACTGLHGANRLASNSLLEAIVFSDRLAKAAAKDGQMELLHNLPDWDSGDAVSSDEQVVLSHTWDEIRRIMWNYVGIVRTDKRLKRAEAKMVALRRELTDYYWNYQLNDKLLEVRNLAEVAYLTIRSAMQRKESRGIHYNIDYNFTSEKAKDTILW